MQRTTKTTIHPWFELACGLVCLMLLTASRLAASETCAMEPEDGTVDILTLDLPAEDVRVRLLSFGLLHVPITVSLEGQQGLVLDTVVVSGRARGEALEVVFSGALADALDRDLSYRIRAEGPAAVALMDPFPFFVKLDCPTPGGSCSYKPLNGVETDALLVSPELADLLADLPDCQLGHNLRLLENSHPDLLGDIRTLQHQLGRLYDNGPLGNACTYAWMAEVVPLEASWNPYHAASPSLEEPTVELQGMASGAAQCVGQQARHLPWNPTSGESFEASGRSRARLFTACISGTPPCAPCAGTVGFAAELGTCAAADTAALCEGSHAEARAEGQMQFRVKEASDEIEGGANPAGPYVELKSSAEAISSFSPLDPPEAWDLDQHNTTAERIVAAPAEAVLESSVWLQNLVEGWAMPQPSCAAPDSSAAYAFAETNLHYELTAVASSSCTEQPMVEVHLVTPGDAALSRDGGLKLKRWRDPPGGG
ncbi:MAG: hypothetical protein AAF657_14075 [Acidobacteriota bacterium]